MLIIYTWVLRLLFPVIILRLLWRGLRNPAYWRRWPERFGFVQKQDHPSVIWVHAVSVGEVRACAPLLRALMASHSDYHIHVTTMTPTGSAQVRDLFKNKVSHSYVPYDYPSAVRRFLHRINPGMLLIMETELWPNIFHACKNRNIPVFVANARMSAKSMRGYLKYRSLTAATLRQVSRISAQSKDDAERIVNLGFDPDKIIIAGNLKFDLEIPESVVARGKALRRSWGEDRLVWIAASTHSGEDELILDAYGTLRDEFPNLLLILVPRHPERFASVAKLCEKQGYKISLRSRQEPRVDERIEILVGDTMGELQLLFATADVAFIGGSLVPVGGHNLLEAAAVGVPVVFGPHMFNFQDIGAMANAAGAGIQIQQSDELAGAVRHYLVDDQARKKAGESGTEMIEQNRGALIKNMKEIERLL